MTLAGVFAKQPNAVGIWLAKHAIAIYSAEPSPHGVRYENLQAQVDAFPLREALIDWNGAAAIEACTVSHQKGQPRIAHVSCLTDAGKRSWAALDDPALLAAMMRQEFCGRRGRVDGHGKLQLDSAAREG